MNSDVYFKLINFYLKIRHMHKFLMRDVLQVIVLRTYVNVC